MGAAINAEESKEKVITAKYDRLIRAVKTDPKTGEISTKKETYHFTFGHIGSGIGGGIYINKELPLPSVLVIKLPKMEE